MTGDALHLERTLALIKIDRTDQPYFVCPDCCSFSTHPDDVENSYCARCHGFKCQSWQRPRCMEPSCDNFGDRDFGGATCPEDHAEPPAKRKRPEEQA